MALTSINDTHLNVEDVTAAKDSASPLETSFTKTNVNLTAETGRIIVASTSTTNFW